jgi:hypothetical protein
MAYVSAIQAIFLYSNNPPTLATSVWMMSTARREMSLFETQLPYSGFLTLSSIPVFSLLDNLLFSQVCFRTREFVLVWDERICGITLIMP